MFDTKLDKIFGTPRTTLGDWKKRDGYRFIVYSFLKHADMLVALINRDDRKTENFVRSSIILLDDIDTGASLEEIVDELTKLNIDTKIPYSKSNVQFILTLKALGVKTSHDY